MTEHEVLDPVRLAARGAQEDRVEVVLREHSRSETLLLPNEARHAFFAVAGDRVRVLATADAARVVLESTSWVGAISVPGLRVRIVPSAPMESIFTMLGGLGDEIAWGHESTTYAGDGELLDGSALVVLRAIDASTRRGLLHGYRTSEENLTTIRGRLLVDQLARAPWNLASPPCRYDEFTVDIEENRLLRCAVRTIMGAHGLTPSTRRRAVELLSRFDGVSDTDAREHPQPVLVTRLNEHYEHAMDLARMALEGFAIRQDDGAQSAHAFLVDVDYVFLRFLAAELRTRLWPTYRVEQAAPLSLDEASALQATADIVIRDATGPRLVIGARYHLEEAGAGSSPVALAAAVHAGTGMPHSRSAMATVANDAAAFFPVMVQAASLGLPSALVVYAHAARRPASRIRMPTTATTVFSWHVDLRRSYEDIGHDLEDLAHRVRTIIE